MSVERRVARGKATLKLLFGDDWYQRVDLDKLRMDDGSRCVLSQVSGGHFQDALSSLGGSYFRDSIPWAEANGFTAQVEDIDADFAYLQAEWQLVISELQED